MSKRTLGRWVLVVALGVGMAWAAGQSLAQEAAAPAAAPAAAAPAAAAPAAPAPAAPAAAAPAAGGDVKMELAPGAQTEGTKQQEDATSLWTVINASGSIGLLIWLSLFAGFVALFYFVTECFILIRPQRIISQALVKKVTEAMQQGDVLKALNHCGEEPGPLANILRAGFSNVEEGFETIQDMVSAAADYESEALLQRVTYLNVVSNLGPLLGLLGTVHGMIFAFATLATSQAGAAQQAMLAINIAESLYCTAAGLCMAVPALTFYYFFRNRATKIILRMEAMTMDLIKSLRNVEVVTE
jgi:biopolymer transport protein ExbB